MDVATLGEASRQAKSYTQTALRGITLSQFAALRSKLDQGLENATICVLGDSTGVGNGAGGTQKRWPYRLAEKLAAAYPAYTVRWRPWNVTNNSYDAFVTVHTGTGTGNAGGPFVIDIYNGSASGTNPTYSQANLLSANGLIPYGVMPDLIMVNHSHNMGTATEYNVVNQRFYGLIRDALRWYNPGAAVVVIGQNPSVVVPDSGVTPSPAEHQRRQARLAEMCATEGWGFINVNRAFLDTPNWQATLLNADGLHPSDAGSALWANLIWAMFQASAYAAPSASRPTSDVIVVPASAFMPSLIIGSSPAPAVLNSFLPVLGYTKQAGVIGATCDVHVPASWRLVNLWVDWTTSDAVAGNVAWQVDVAQQSRVFQEIASAVGSAALAMATGSSPTTGTAPSVALAESHTRIGGDSNGLGYLTTSPQNPRRMYLRVGRSGANAADTYPGTAQFLRLRIERAA